MRKLVTPVAVGMAVDDSDDKELVSGCFVANAVEYNVTTLLESHAGVTLNSGLIT